jgi:hypothetical protein
MGEDGTTFLRMPRGWRRFNVQRPGVGGASDRPIVYHTKWTSTSSETHLQLLYTPRIV